MIAFLPEDGSWCKQELPHMTLVYAGETDGRPSTDLNAIAKDMISVARVTGSFGLEVLGVEEFGPDDDRVDVLTFHPTPQLLVARNMVSRWNASEFKEYKPHATIGPAGSAYAMNVPTGDRYSDDVPVPQYRRNLPLRLYFNRIVTCWGNEKLVFRLGDF